MEAPLREGIAAARAVGAAPQLYARESWEAFEAFHSTGFAINAPHQITAGDVGYWIQEWEQLPSSDPKKTIRLLRVGNGSSDINTRMFSDNEACDQFATLLSKLLVVSPKLILSFQGQQSFQDIYLLESLKTVPITAFLWFSFEMKGAEVGEAFRALFAAWAARVEILVVNCNDYDVEFKKKFFEGLRYLSCLQQVQFHFLDHDLPSVVGALVGSGGCNTLAGFVWLGSIKKFSLPALETIATQFTQLSSFQFNPDQSCLETVKSALHQNTTISRICFPSDRRGSRGLHAWARGFERRNKLLHFHYPLLLIHTNIHNNNKMWPTILHRLELTNHRDNTKEVTAVYEFIKLKAPNLGCFSRCRRRAETQL